MQKGRVRWKIVVADHSEEKQCIFVLRILGKWNWHTNNWSISRIIRLKTLSNIQLHWGKKTKRARSERMRENWNKISPYPPSGVLAIYALFVSIFVAYFARFCFCLFPSNFAVFCFQRVFFSPLIWLLFELSFSH